MKKLRFSLRSTLIAMALVCFLLGGLPAAYEAWLWNSVVEQVRTVFDETKQADNYTFRGGYYHGTHWRLANYRYRPAVEDQDLSTTKTAREAKDKQADGLVYVWPPGQWVRSSEEAVALLKLNL